MISPSKAILLAGLLAACLHASAAGCTSPIGRDFPAGSLQEAGLSAPALLKINQEIDAAGYDVRGLLILRGCKVVFERYKSGMERDHAHALYSITKSITGTVVGRLLAEGEIKDLHVPLADLIQRPWGISDDDWAKLRTIQLEHAMRLRSGIQWTHDVKNGNPVHSTFADMLRDGVRLPMAFQPGEKFVYSDYDGALVGFAVSGATKLDLPEATQRWLYDAMGIPPSGWDFRDRVGRYSGGFGARLRPMDMLKIGQLYLQKGKWNDKQLISPEFVKLSMPQDGEHRGEFGLMWWSGKNPDLGDMRFFFASGRKAQRIYVFPDWEMVVALVSSLAAEDEQRLLRPLIKGLKAVATEAADSSAIPNALIELSALSAKGFSGTRSFAESIDAPRIVPSR